jgi:hypothetical protein
MQFTERVLVVGIGAACIFAVTGLLMGFTPEQAITPIITFVVGTFFPSMVNVQQA